MALNKCSFCLNDAFKRGLIDLNSKVYGILDGAVVLADAAFDIFRLHVSSHVSAFSPVVIKSQQMLIVVNHSSSTMHSFALTVKRVLSTLMSSKLRLRKFSII